MHPAMISLLPALDALLDEASVTRAAQRLHVSPPAMSRTLTRLRELLHDPLLVRAGRGLVLTARGAALKSDVRQLVEQASHLLSRDESRLADTQPRVLSVRADDGVAALLGDRLLARAARPGERTRAAFSCRNRRKTSTTCATVASTSTSACAWGMSARCGPRCCSRTNGRC